MHWPMPELKQCWKWSAKTKLYTINWKKMKILPELISQWFHDSGHVARQKHFEWSPAFNHSKESMSCVSCRDLLKVHGISSENSPETCEFSGRIVLFWYILENQQDIVTSQLFVLNTLPGKIQSSLVLTPFGGKKALIWMKKIHSICKQSEGLMQV